MEVQSYDLNSLFSQLGLDASDEAIDYFLCSAKRIPRAVPLHKASMWTPSQSKFLQQAIDEDADWAEVVDQLDSLLRK